MREKNFKRENNFIVSVVVGKIIYTFHFLTSLYETSVKIREDTKLPLKQKRNVQLIKFNV